MKNSLSKIVVVTSSGLQQQMLDAIDVDHNTATVIAVPDDRGEIMAAIPEADALINCPRHLFDSALLSQARQLKWIHCGGAGVEEFLIPELIGPLGLLTLPRVFLRCVTHIPLPSPPRLANRMLSHQVHGLKLRSARWLALERQ